MRAIPFVVLVLSAAGIVMFGVAFLFMADDRQATSVQRPAAPRLSVVEPKPGSLDVLHGEKVQLQIKVKNDSRVTVNATEVLGTCGCARARLVPNTLQPGDSAILSVSFNSGVKPAGEVSLEFFVLTKEGHRIRIPEILLCSRQDVVFTPPFLDIGDVVDGERVQRVLTITSKSTDQIPASATVKTSSEDVQLEIEQSDMTQAITKSDEGNRLPLVVRAAVHAAQSPIRFNEHIEITLPAFRGRDRTFTIPVIGRVVEAVQANPEHLFLGVIRPSSPIRRTLNVRHVIGKTVTIESVQAPNWVRLNWQAKSVTASKSALDIEFVLFPPPNSVECFTLGIKVSSEATCWSLKIPCNFIATSDNTPTSNSSAITERTGSLEPTALMNETTLTPFSQTGTSWTTPALADSLQISPPMNELYSPDHRVKLPRTTRPLAFGSPGTAIMLAGIGLPVVFATLWITQYKLQLKRWFGRR